MSFRHKGYKFQRIQILLMLQAFGIPQREIPRKAEKMDALLDAFRANKPDEFDEYFRRFVKFDFSESEAAQKVIPIAEASQMFCEDIQLRFNEQISSNITEFAGMLDATKDEIATALKEAIAIEAQKYQTHQVQIGDGPVQTLTEKVHEKFDDVLQLAAARLNILLVGPAGSGKTYMAPQIAKALGLDYASQSCSEGVSESQFTGWLLPIGDNGKFEYVESPFVRLYENGGVMLLDEFDALDANVGVFLNQAIAGDHFYLPQRHTNPRVDRHPDFIVIAAANTYGTGANVIYSGRNQLDAATLDRFKVGTVEIGYPDDVEQQLIDPDLLEWGRNVRNIIERHHIQKIMSMRVLRDMTTMIGVGWSRDKVKTHYFSDWTDQEKATMERIS